MMMVNTGMPSKLMHASAHVQTLFLKQKKIKEVENKQRQKAGCRLR
jgi:hypothetical protein